MLLMKSQITRTKINLPKLFFVNYVRARYQQLIAIFHLVIIKTVNMYSLVQCVKLFLVLSILTLSSFPANHDFCRLLISCANRKWFQIRPDRMSGLNLILSV